MKNTIELNSKKDRYEFRRMKAVTACVSTDPTREAIQNVRVEKDGEGILVIGTDGRRLRADHFDIEVTPGTYEVKARTASTLFLVKSRSRLKFPDWRQVIPSVKPKDAHAFQGMGKRFVLWACAGLGCYIDPALVELRDDEGITLYIQKKGPGLSPALLKNETTTLVLMPIRCTESWAREIEGLRKAA